MKYSFPAIFAVIALAPMLLPDQVVLAQSHPSVRLTPAQTQQLSRDLVRFSSQDFFNQGRQQLESEIKILTQRRLFLRAEVLKISQDLQLQRDFSKFESPSIAPEK